MAEPERDHSKVRLTFRTDYCKITADREFVVVDYPMDKVRELADDLDALERGRRYLDSDGAVDMPPVANVSVKGHG